MAAFKLSRRVLFISFTMSPCTTWRSATKEKTSVSVLESVERLLETVFASSDFTAYFPPNKLFEDLFPAFSVLSFSLDLF